MADQKSQSVELDKDKSTSYKITASPSETIKHHEKTLDIDGLSLNLILVTMKRSFLLVISNSNGSKGDDRPVTKDQMIRGFMNSNLSLRGLSLAIGRHNSCIINSEAQLDSSTLASRLSKKLNQNRPVYVANNFTLPSDIIDISGFTAKLYMRIFQFVGSNYQGQRAIVQDISEQSQAL